MRIRDSATKSTAFDIRSLNLRSSPCDMTFCILQRYHEYRATAKRLRDVTATFCSRIDSGWHAAIKSARIVIANHLHECTILLLIGDRNEKKQTR